MSSGLEKLRAEKLAGWASVGTYFSTTLSGSNIYSLSSPKTEETLTGPSKVLVRALTYVSCKSKVENVSLKVQLIKNVFSSLAVLQKRLKLPLFLTILPTTKQKYMKGVFVNN